jgi:peptidyl-prolyl cis-trans isomerase B (cyclophilin B)
MQIYIHRNNEQLGPFTEAEVKAKLASGAISLEDHVWWQGQANWVQLGQSPLPGTTAPSVGGSVPETSKFAIWALVCGCLSLFCSLFASIPAIILGHMGLSETKKNPALQGRGMALAGIFLGYIITTIVVLYLILVVVLIAMGGTAKDFLKGLSWQVNAAQATNSADQSATTPDQTTNTPEPTTPAPATTNTPDQSTNSAPAATNTPDQSTNSAPAATNTPDQSTNSTPATTNSPTSNTNAPDSSTNAAPMNQ